MGVVPIKVLLADGKEYKLSPLNLNMLCDVEAEYGGTLTTDMLAHPTFKLMRSIALARLKVNHPDMTAAKVGELIEPENLKAVIGL